MTSLCPCCNQPVREGGDLAFNWDQGTVIGNGKSVRLLPTEADVFRAFYEKHPRIVRRETVLDFVYGSSPDRQPTEKIIDVHICHINAKLKGFGAHIGNVKGRGFRLVKAERSK